MLTENKTERRNHHGLQDQDSVGNRCAGIHIRIAAAGNPSDGSSLEVNRHEPPLDDPERFFLQSAGHESGSE